MARIDDARAFLRMTGIVPEGLTPEGIALAEKLGLDPDDHPATTLEVTAHIMASLAKEDGE